MLARQLDVTLGEEAKTLCSAFWLAVRRISAGGYRVEQLHTLLRLARAHARLHLRTIATGEYRSAMYIKSSSID